MIPNLFQTVMRCSVAFCLMHSVAYSQSVINRSLAPADRQGVLEPYRDTDVATAEMGVIRELFVKPGDVVDDKDEIARLDNEQQRLMMQEAEIDAAALGIARDRSARSQFQSTTCRRNLKVSGSRYL